MAKMPYNLLAGLAQEMLGEGNAPGPGQLWAGINRIDVQRCAGAFRLTSGKTGLIVDSSGLKQHNTGAWLERKRKVRRGSVKIRILVDVDTKNIPALKIADEPVGDSAAFEELLDGALKMIGRPPKASAAEEIEKKESVRTFAKDAVKEAIRDAAGAEPGDPAAAGRAAEKIARGAVSDITYEPPAILYADAAYGSRDNVKAAGDAGPESGIALRRTCSTKGKGRCDSWSAAVRDQLGAGEKCAADVPVEDRQANREEWKRWSPTA